MKSMKFDRMENNVLNKILIAWKIMFSTKSASVSGSKIMSKQYISLNKNENEFFLCKPVDLVTKQIQTFLNICVIYHIP